MARVQTTAAQTDAGSPIDTDLMDQGLRLNDDDHETRILALEAGGGGGGAAGVEVDAKFTQLRKTFGESIVDSSSKCLCDSFSQSRPFFNYRLMRNVSPSDTTIYVAPNPITIEGDSTTNLNFNFTGFTWTAVTGSDASTVAADATNFLLGTESLSWSKTGTATDSFVQRDVTAANAFSIGAYKKILLFFRTSTITNLSNVAVRLSADAADPVNYAEWRVTTQQLGAGFIASGTGIGWNICLIDLSATPDATAGTGFNINTQLARTWAAGSNWASSGQTASLNVDSFWHVPHVGSGTLVSHPEVDRLAQNGEHVFFINNSVKEEKIFDVSGASSNPSVIGQVDVTAGFTNALTGGSSTTIRKDTLNTDNGIAEFERTDSELTSGVSEKDQSIVLRGHFPAPISAANVDISVDFYTPLKFFVESKPSSTTFRANVESDLSAEMLSGATFRLYSVRWANGRMHPKEITGTAGQVTLTANSSFSANQITFTVSTGDNAKVSVGYLFIKENELKVAKSIVSSSSNEESLTSYLTPNERQVEQIGIDYPKRSFIVGHYYLGGLTSAIAVKNRANFNINSLPDLTLNGTVPINNAFRNGQFGAGPFTATTDYYSLSAADSADLDPDNAVAPDKFSGSIWIYRTATPVDGDPIVSKWTGGAAGYLIYIGTSNEVRVVNNAGDQSSGLTLNLNAWNHLAWSFYDDGTGTAPTSVWVNGVRFNFASSSFLVNSTTFRIGSYSTLDTDSHILADLGLWAGAQLDDSDVSIIRNSGVHTPMGNVVGSTKYLYNLTSQTGERVALHLNLKSETNTHTSYVNKANLVSLA